MYHTTGLTKAQIAELRAKIASREIKPWLPTIRAALDQLRECDDLTFVEVQEPGQVVRVAKSGGSIVYREPTVVAS